jgi:hypothetical protein
VYFTTVKNNILAGCWWLTPGILVTQETEIRRIMVQSQPVQIALQDPISKKPITKKGAGGVARGVAPEFKPKSRKINK